MIKDGKIGLNFKEIRALVLFQNEWNQVAQES
jgi:hypothetical protein